MQLLWVNLIMDTLGALALATETPSPKLLVSASAGHSNHEDTTALRARPCFPTQSPHSPVTWRLSVMGVDCAVDLAGQSA